MTKEQEKINDHARSTIFASILTGDVQPLRNVAADNEVMADAAEWLTKQWEERFEHRDRCMHMIQRLHSMDGGRKISQEWLIESKVKK